MANDPAFAQAVSYAAWYLARGASESEIEGRLAQSRDHKWMSADDRLAAIEQARGQVRLLQRLWELRPQLKVELTPASRIRRVQSARPKQRGEN